MLRCELMSGKPPRLPKVAKRLDFDGGTGFSDEEEPTRITCPACGGNWQIVSETSRGVKMTTCRARGCARGTMAPKDAVAWRKEHPRR